VVVEVTVAFQDALVAFKSLEIGYENDAETECLPTMSHVTGILPASAPFARWSARRLATTSAAQAIQEQTKPAGRMSTADLSRMIEQRKR
jgi:hypothetical protein